MCFVIKELFTNLSPNNKKVVDCESVVILLLPLCYIVKDQEKE